MIFISEILSILTALNYVNIHELKCISFDIRICFVFTIHHSPRISEALEPTSRENTINIIKISALILI